MGTLVETVRGRVRLRTRVRRTRDAVRAAWHRVAPLPLAVGELRTTGTKWALVRPDQQVTVAAGQVGEPLDEEQRTALAGLAAVTCPPGAPPELVTEFAQARAVLHTPVPDDRLAPELAALLATPLPARGADPIDWEIRGVRQRRAARRAGAATPPVSALLVTRRPALLPAALAALARQTYPELEIVVCLHGVPGRPSLPDPGRPVRLVEVPADQPLGAALAAATAAASGTVLTKVDDDDRYGPEHVWDLVLARQQTGAAVVGKAAEFVYLAPKDRTVRRRMAFDTFTDVVAGGTLTLDRDTLAAAGGWPPVPRSVDRALLDRVLAAGGTVYCTHPFGFIYTRNRDGHTWQQDLSYFLRDPVRTWRGLPPYEEFGDAATPAPASPGARSGGAGR